MCLFILFKLEPPKIVHLKEVPFVPLNCNFVSVGGGGLNFTSTNVRFSEVLQQNDRLTKEKLFLKECGLWHLEITRQK